MIIFVGLGNSESKSVGCSHVKELIPIFPLVEKRGDEEYQLGQNLITEDLLLRDILLSCEEQQQHCSLLLASTNEMIGGDGQRLTIWFKHIKHLTISIYQDVFVQIGTVRTGKSDTDRD